MKRIAEILDARKLGAVIGGDWQGWSWAEGKIFAPGWREGVGPDDIRALPYLNELAEDYRRATQRYDAEMARMREKLERANESEKYYRKQLRIAAKLGVALQRIAGSE